MKLFARHWPFTLLRASVLAAASVGLITVWAAGESDPGALREKAEALERKAQELKDDGQPERAREVMRQVEELRTEARKSTPDRIGRERVPGAPEGRQAMRELREARAQLQELRAAGKEEEAARLQRRIRELEEKSRSERPVARRTEPRDPLRRPNLRNFGQEQPDFEQRLGHLKVAIDNLHAAGLHEVADRVAEQAKSMMARPPGMAGGPPMPGNRPEMERRVQAELQELRQAVRELRAQVDQLRGQAQK